MTRATLGLTIALGTIVLSVPCSALEASDTMASWKHASPGERAKLVERLMTKGSGRSQAGIIACVDGAANVSGHMSLHIGEVIKACMSSRNDTEPV